MKKLKRWFAFNNLKGNLFIIGLSIILLFLFFNTYNIIILFLLIALLVYALIKHKVLFIITLIITLVLSSIYISKCIIYNMAPTTINKKLIVDKVRNEENYQYVLFKDGIYKYIYYNKDEYFNVGDIYYINAKVIKQTKEHTPRRV